MRNADPTEQEVVYETNCHGVSPKVTAQAKQYMGRSGLVSGRVVDAGGGEVRLLLDRDTEAYPEVGEQVIVLRLIDYSSRARGQG